MRKKILHILIFISFHQICLSQNQYNKGYFDSPLKIKMELVGNFGEIRPNHFHSGFDFRTNGKEGLPIYAVADGYISRIKISAGGYGKALYINHPNGYTSVYAHLQRYNTAIAEFAKAIEYTKESFEIDTTLSEKTILIKKGDLIGFSGNTGSSEAPHLHFEIRDTKTEMPINPYLLGYTIPDNVKPTITQLAVYPIGEKATINSKHEEKKIKTVYANGKYSINKQDTIIANGDIGFGIECNDSETGSTNQNAVFSIELQADGKRIYYYEMEKFSFENSRYVNTHMDYKEKQKNNFKIQKCFLSKNNKIEIYKDVVNFGLVNFNDNSLHLIKFIVTDFTGNSSDISLKVKSSSKCNLKALPIIDNAILFDCSKDNEYKKDDIEIFIPAYALFDDLLFNHSETPIIKGTYSLLHRIQNKETALQKPYSLSIKPINMPIYLQNKAVVISINNIGKKNYEGGSFKNGYVTTQTKIFGNFAVSIDTTAPSLKPNFKFTAKNYADFSKTKKIEIGAKDNLSGIKKYSATIDGNWVLCEYEIKKDLLFYTFDNTIKSGKHVFNLEVKDDKDNTSTLNFIFDN